jgi:hypothetical protein
VIYIDSGTATTAGTNDTWVVWTQGTQTSATCGTGTQIWSIWSGGTGASVTSAATTGNIIWQSWVDDVAATGATPAVVRRMGYPTEVRASPRRKVSPEERAVYEARERELQAKLEAEREYRRIAEGKAEILLNRLLTEEQRETLKEKRCFYMYSNGKKYRIDRGQHGNVKLLDAKDQIVESYCIQPQGGIPDADAMAAQKLLLEADPETFVRVANITRRDGSYRQGSPLRAVG